MDNAGVGKIKKAALANNTADYHSTTKKLN